MIKLGDEWLSEGVNSGELPGQLLILFQAFKKYKYLTVSLTAFQFAKDQRQETNFSTIHSRIIIVHL